MKLKVKKSRELYLVFFFNKGTVTVSKYKTNLPMDDFYLTSNAALLLSNARAMQPKEGENENLGGISKSTLKALIGQFLGLLIGCIICGVISLLCK